MTHKQMDYMYSIFSQVCFIDTTHVHIIHVNYNARNGIILGVDSAY